MSGAGILIPAPPLVGQWKVTGAKQETEADTAGLQREHAQVGEPAWRARMSRSWWVSSARKIAYALVDDPEKIENVIDTVRIGRELFPLLMALILLVVTLESLLANTFYKDRPAMVSAFASPRRGGS